ncbi:unnamed protein product [Timema podura]|uniref:Uncharacterized protein n=1 Tax=Timema podura TaxID=61482 RepID=A0ABN7NRU9_TIMPD|nr:unnamed protein product [Timema podura]
MQVHWEVPLLKVNYEAEVAQQQACDKFEQMSDKAKEELMDFKTRRVAAFRKNLIDTCRVGIEACKGAGAVVQELSGCAQRGVTKVWTDDNSAS